MDNEDEIKELLGEANSIIETLNAEANALSRSLTECEAAVSDLKKKLERRDKSLHMQSHQVAEAAVLLGEAKAHVQLLVSGKQAIRDALIEVRESFAEHYGHGVDPSVTYAGGYLMGLRLAYVLLLSQEERNEKGFGGEAWWAKIETADMDAP